MKHYREIEKELLANTGLLKIGKRISEEIPPFKKESDQPLDKFLAKLLKEYFRNYTTVYAKDETHQCDGRKNRSLGDIFLVCKYYYPDTSLKTLKQLIFSTKFYPESGYSADPICSIFCPNIKKRVFQFQSTKAGWNTHHGVRSDSKDTNFGIDEFGILWNYWWHDVEDLPEYTEDKQATEVAPALTVLQG